MKIPIQTKISLVALILINLSGLAGILFFNWNSADLLLAYWVESLVIGFYNILKMNRAKEPSSFINATINGKTIGQNKRSTIYFFLTHYGFFMLIHLIFLITFISTGIGGLHPNVNFLKTLLNALILGLGLFVSHGISYKKNFIENGEYKRTTVSDLFSAPYKRIVVMYLTILIGALIMIPAIFLILLKTAIDVISHLKERKRFSAK